MYFEKVNFFNKLNKRENSEESFLIYMRKLENNKDIFRPMYIHTIHLEKKIIKDGNQKIKLAVLDNFSFLILGWFRQFDVIICRFASFLVPYRRPPIARILTFFFQV